jgi:hypothetical protein
MKEGQCETSCVIRALFDFIVVTIIIIIIIFYYYYYYLSC